MHSAGYWILFIVSDSCSFVLLQGILPYRYLGLNQGEVAEILYANTKQMLEQYQVNNNNY